MRRPVLIAIALLCLTASFPVASADPELLPRYVPTGDGDCIVINPYVFPPVAIVPCPAHG